jgi:hypothetical protein
VITNRIITELLITRAETGTKRSRTKNNHDT